MEWSGTHKGRKQEGVLRLIFTALILTGGILAFLALSPEEAHAAQEGRKLPELVLSEGESHTAGGSGPQEITVTARIPYDPEQWDPVFFLKAEGTKLYEGELPFSYLRYRDEMLFGICAFSIQEDGAMTEAVFRFIAGDEERTNYSVRMCCQDPDTGALHETEQTFTIDTLSQEPDGSENDQPENDQQDTDSLPPVISVKEPEGIWGTAELTGGVWRTQVSVTDDEGSAGSGLAGIGYEIKDQRTGKTDSGILFEDGDGTGSGSWSGTIPIDPKTFPESDLSVTVRAADRAGNHSEESFLIRTDTVKPLIRLGYSFGDEKSGCYPDAQKVFLRITEHNFDPHAVKMSEGTELVWTSEGDLHMSEIVCQEEGNYAVSVSCTDLAGNQADPPEVRIFTIDREPPALFADGIEDGAFCQQITGFQVYAADRHLNADNTCCELAGKRTGVRKKLQAKRISPESLVFVLDEEEGLPDDRYTLHAEATDLAGNQNVFTILFFVNGSGSSFHQDAESQKASARYFLNQAQAFSITETNIVPISESKITAVHNGAFLDLRAGTDYFAERKETAEGWSCTYLFPAEMFSEDGDYHIGIVTIDAAGNVSSSSAQGIGCEYFLDRKAPQVDLSLQKDGKVRLFAHDAGKLDSVEIYAGGKVYKSYETKEGTVTDEPDLTGLSAGTAVYAIARDAAGNESRSRILTVRSQSHQKENSRNRGSEEGEGKEENNLRQDREYEQRQQQELNREQQRDESEDRIGLIIVLITAAAAVLFLAVKTAIVRREREQKRRRR